MYAKKLVLETDGNGHIKQPLSLPPNAQLEAIFLLIEDKQKSSVLRRKPSPKIANKGQILGDIITPITDVEDWNALA